MEGAIKNTGVDLDILEHYMNKYKKMKELA